MMYSKALLFIAALRSLAVPMITEASKWRRWSHFLISSGHVVDATLSGAMISTFETFKSFKSKSFRAVNVITVFPSPMSKNKAETGWDLI